jgi:hypothetical protein
MKREEWVLKLWAAVARLKERHGSFEDRGLVHPAEGLTGSPVNYDSFVKGQKRPAQKLAWRSESIEKFGEPYLPTALEIEEICAGARARMEYNNARKRWPKLENPSRETQKQLAWLRRWRRRKTSG